MKVSAAVMTAALVFTVALAPVPAPAADADPVVAKVNGATIKRSEVKEAYDHLPEQYHQIPLEQIFPALINNLIDTKLAAAAGRKAKLDKTPEFKASMAAFADRLLGSSVIEKEVGKKVTDAAVKAKYEETVKAMGGQTEVHARHILVKTEDEAKAVIKELAGGADFAELAKKRSTGPSGPNGGDLGFFGKGQMVPEFDKAVFSMKKGEVTQAPVKTQFGWHVIKVEETRVQQPPAFEDMAPQIRETLSREAGNTYIQGLREGAKIERFNLDGTPAK